MSDDPQLPASGDSPVPDPYPSPFQSAPTDPPSVSAEIPATDSAAGPGSTSFTHYPATPYAEPAKRFGNRGIAYGLAIPILVSVAWSFLVIGLGRAGFATNNAALTQIMGLFSFVVSGVLTLGIPIVGLVLAARPGSPMRRGIGLGMIIGWGLLLVIGAGLCIAILSSFGG